MKKQLGLIGAAILLILSLGQAVWAFSDTAGDPNAAKIEALQKAGIVAGGQDGKFNPAGQLTYAEGISLIVRGLGLNIDSMKFVKKPEVRDYYTSLSEDAWYSQAFIIAHLSGLTVPKDVKAGQPLTKEQFALYLYEGIQRTGDYADIEIYVSFKDEAEVGKTYMESIQKLLIRKIASLDGQKMFHPKKAMTRGEAAAWVHDAIAFVKAHKELPPVEQPAASPLTELKLTAAPVNDKVTEVTVTAKAPNPGYGLRIVSVVFEGTSANIYVEAVLPNPNQMYIQKITDVSALTYIGAGYKPVLFENGVPVPGDTGAGAPAKAQGTTA